MSSKARTTGSHIENETNRRQSIKRGATTKGSTMQLTVPLLLSGVYTMSVMGSGCTLPPCGRVNNGSPYRLKWADFGGGCDFCQVYNWHGSDDSEKKNSVRRPCTQDWVNPGQDKGGYWNDGIDVDGFCFHDRGYKIVWEDGLHQDIPAGVWTKIGSGQTASCRSIEGTGTPVCSIAGLL